eukprot:12416384-Karenia_brevis.AAC.1
MLGHLGPMLGYLGTILSNFGVLFQPSWDQRPQMTKNLNFTDLTPLPPRGAPGECERRKRKAAASLVFSTLPLKRGKRIALFASG